MLEEEESTTTAADGTHRPRDGERRSSATPMQKGFMSTAFLFGICLLLYLINRQIILLSEKVRNAGAATTTNSDNNVRRTRMITLGRIDTNTKTTNGQQSNKKEQSLRIQEGPGKEPAPNAEQQKAVNQQLQQVSSANDSAVHVLNEPLPKSANIIKLSESLESCESTIVTGYFRIKSKFPAAEYLAWMTNFLSVQDCLVIFTSAEMMDNIRELRAHAPSRTVLIRLDIDDLPIARLHQSTDPQFWQHQLDIDYEKKTHKSFQLFWIWLSKSWCVQQAIDQNFFQSNIFMWQDIGSFRNKKYNGKRIMQHPEMIPPKTILWMAHHPPQAPPDPIWNDKRRQGQYYFHSGSQGAGSKEAWIEYHQKFAQTMEMFLERKMFIGEDQCVLQATCQRFPQLCAYVRQRDVKDNHYFGLRYVLVYGGNYEYWRMPGGSES